MAGAIPIADSTRFHRLLEPGKIGAVHTKNRILKTGSTLGFYPWEDGHIQQPVIDSYETLAKGGAGLVTVGAAPLGVPPGMGYLMNDDKYLPGMIRLAEAIGKHDCPAFAQMFHLGPMLPPFLVPAGVKPFAASMLEKREVPLPWLSVPQELSVSEIEEIVQQFGDQAERIKRAGFQGIELNAGSNHLLNSFVSRFWNRRQDAYGVGSLESRAKILVDIIREVKRLNGKDFAIIALINGAEPGLENGITPKEAQGIAAILETAGADAIHVREEFYNRPKDPSRRDCTQLPDVAFYPEAPFSLHGVVDASRHGAGGWVPMAAAVRQAVSIPVIAIGRLDPELGEEVLRHGQADLFSFNRCLMADPELPSKLAAGKREDVRPCTGCTTCFDSNEHGNSPLCQVTAALGREKEYQIQPAPKKKRVMVIGSGPVGLEAARVAALRGHEVTLCEKERRSGGSMLLASVVKGSKRQDLLKLIRCFETQVTKLGVQMVHLGTWQNPLFPTEPPISDLPPAGASPVHLDTPGDSHRDLIRELTIPEIDEIVDRWASAAVRAQQAGFDGVDINAGSTHLMHNFLSPFRNRRQDAYGGSRENRARFLVEVIREIKDRCGQDFPVAVCMNGIEIGRTAGIDDDRCMTVEDSQGLAKIIEAAGADAIQARNQWLGYHVGGFLPDYLFYPDPPIPLREFPKEYNASQRGAGANIHLAEGLKEVLTIPVIVVGKLDPELGERVLREGKADFIAMTWGIIADTELPNKIAAGRLEDVAPCTACGTCLDQSIQMKRRCRINAAIATEKNTVDKAEKRKRVVVVGGGPAGMEAARVAALRGHDVTLYEKSSKLGGLLDLAALKKGASQRTCPVSFAIYRLS